MTGTYRFRVPGGGALASDDTRLTFLDYTRLAGMSHDVDEGGPGAWLGKLHRTVKTAFVHEDRVFLYLMIRLLRSDAPQRTVPILHSQI